MAGSTCDAETRNIWTEIYGVKHDPFATNPISSVRGGLVPRESFIGRIEEMKIILRDLFSGGGSRIIVTGDVGVGKTTFVNVARMKAMENGMFSPFPEIGITGEWNTEDMITNTLDKVYSTFCLMPDKEKYISGNNFNTLKDMLESSKDMGFSVSAAGYGGGYSSAKRMAPKVSFSALFRIFQEIVSDVVEHTKKDIIIHYNNIENMDPKDIGKMFEDMRDFFHTPHVHFVFVGNLIAKERMLAVQRFSSIVTNTITLKPQSPEEVEDIIRKRFEFLKVPNLNPIVPFQREALDSLYKIFSGNIREILNSLSKAVKAATIDKHVILNNHLLGLTLRNIAETRYLTDLTNTEKKVLKAAIKLQEFTNSALTKEVGLKSQNISLYLKRLRENNCIMLKSQRGRENIYEIQPEMRWLMLEVPPEVGQKSLLEFDENR